MIQRAGSGQTPCPLPPADISGDDSSLRIAGGNVLAAGAAASIASPAKAGRAVCAAGPGVNSCLWLCFTASLQRLILLKGRKTQDERVRALVRPVPAKHSALRQALRPPLRHLHGIAPIETRLCCHTSHGSGFLSITLLRRTTLPL